MSNDIEIHVRGKDSSGRAFASALANASKLAAALGSLGAVSGVAAGGLLALPAAGAAGAAAMGTLAVAFKGVGDAMSASDPAEYAQAMAKLAPTAQGFVAELQRVNSSLTDLRTTTQDQFFAPLLGGAEQLAGAYLPTLNRQVPLLSRSLGEAARGWVDVVSQAGNVDRVGRIIESSAVSTKNLGRATEAGTTAFLRLGDAGGTTMERLTGGIERGAGAFERFIARAQADGSLDQAFDMAADAAEGLADVVTPLLGSLYELGTSAGAVEGLETLFAVLTSTSTAVSGLVSAFASLPDGAQSTLIILGALGLVASKLSGAAQGVAGWSARAGEALGRMGAGGEQAGRGLQAAAAGAGRVAVALAATQVAGAALGGSVNPQVEKLSESMAEWAKTGEAGGEAARLFGEDLELLRYDMGAASEGFAEGAAKIVEAITGIGAVADTSIQKSAERTAALDEALAQMVQSGNAETAAQAMGKFSQIAKEEGTSIEDLKAKLPLYAAALDGAGTAQLKMIRFTTEASREQRILNGSWADAVNALGSLSGAFDMLNGKFLGFREAEIAAEEATDRFVEAFKASNGSLDENTAAGRETESMLIKLSGATELATQKQYEQTGSLDMASATFQEHKIAVIEAMTAITGNRQAAEALASQYMKMPALNIQYQSVRDAAFAVMTLQQRLDALPRLKEIHINTFNNQINRITRLEDRFGGPQRWGGITPVHARQGLLSAANIFSGGPPLYAFAEPETRQEAFIPRNGDMSRSRGIARHVVDNWLGGPDAIWGGNRGGQPAGGQGTVINNNITVNAGLGADGASIGRQIIGIIRQYEIDNGTQWRTA